jgi:hypothetical protein
VAPPQQLPEVALREQLQVGAEVLDLAVREAMLGQHAVVVVGKRDLGARHQQPDRIGRLHELVRADRLVLRVVAVLVAAAVALLSVELQQQARRRHRLVHPARTRASG